MLPVGDPKELDEKKITITLKMAIWLGAIMAFMGFVCAFIYFSFAEVDGLRSDWERENVEIHRRLEHLEKYHERPIGN